MDKFIVESPAKINLGLNVVRKRIDDYHDIETIFLPIMLSDRITFCKSDKLNLKSDSDILNKLSDNLILKAVRLLESILMTKIQLDIYIEKIIPIGGGLGGGSSNAASTLKAVNKMYDFRLNFQKLSELALQLGSDVPFFLNPIPSYAESRGEILYPLNIELACPILIVNPGIKIDTAWAFKKIRPSKPIENLRDIFQKGSFDINNLKEYVKNDFEEIVFQEFPEIKKLKADLFHQGAEFALMSGTGSTVYGIFSNLQKAHWAEDYFRQNYFTYLNNPFSKGSIT